jgi:hypothetical protein
LRASIQQAAAAAELETYNQTTKKSANGAHFSTQTPKISQPTIGGLFYYSLVALREPQKNSSQKSGWGHFLT